MPGPSKESKVDVFSNPTKTFFRIQANVTSFMNAGFVRVSEKIRKTGKGERAVLFFCES